MISFNKKKKKEDILYLSAPVNASGAFRFGRLLSVNKIILIE